MLRMQLQADDIARRPTKIKLMEKNTVVRLTTATIRIAIIQVALFFAFKWGAAYASSLFSTHKDNEKRIKPLLKNKKPVNLTEHENIIASELILPEDINVHFSDIGGLDDVIHSLEETVLIPLRYPNFFDNDLLAPPKGILLHGPPGCGKTMLAKAIACESGAAFINLRISTLTEKWFGESQKLVKAVFTLAQKLQPAIIFIDEIDAFLRERQSNDHETISMMKAEFMSLWDGMKSSNRIVVMGATNRPGDLDKAILRRMPKMFNVGLPNHQQRVNILNLTLRGQELDETCQIEEIARVTAGYSGSDLKEMCRNAAALPLREYLREHKPSKEAMDTMEKPSMELRKLRLQDFTNAEQTELRRMQDQISQQNRASFLRFNVGATTN